MVIRMRHTRSHTKNRRSHHALKAQALTKDRESQNFSLRHRMDPETGMYKGRQVVDLTKKLVKKAKKKTSS